MTGIVLSASLLLGMLGSAVTCRTYEQGRNDPAKQSKLFNNAFEEAIGRTLAGLRDTHFRDGKEKSQQRIERDQARASRVESLVADLTNEQSSALIKMIAQYAEAQPDTTLEDVISGFLLAEADKLAATKKSENK
jgi:hypothetical protein